MPGLQKIRKVEDCAQNLKAAGSIKLAPTERKFADSREGPGLDKLRPRSCYEAKPFQQQSIFPLNFRILHCSIVHSLNMVLRKAPLALL